jgi:hypothetical protein
VEVCGDSATQYGEFEKMIHLTFTQKRKQATPVLRRLNVGNAHCTLHVLKTAGSILCLRAVTASSSLMITEIRMKNDQDCVHGLKPGCLATEPKSFLHFFI